MGVIIFLSCFILLGASYAFLSRKLHCWLPYFLWQKFLPQEKAAASKPTHIFLCIADHFEPGHANIPAAMQEQRIKSWLKGYPRMALRHRDADGYLPQHTWFYPPHHPLRFLNELVALCKQGCGEIEMHLHHNRMQPFPEGPHTLESKIRKCLQDYGQYGIFRLPDGSSKFAFVHGDWSLDNSRGKKFCGVNNEIEILKTCGCYADFTFPCALEAQPAMVNKIYYAKDNPNKPKSYNWGKEVRAGIQAEADIMMVTGIIGIRWFSSSSKFKPSLEISNLDSGDKPFPRRIDYWVRNAISIKGKPEWKFIKLHTHGAPEPAWDCLFGEAADSMFHYIESQYNDGKKYALHYVTARQMYNIIKAAEAGKDGNPDNYRNYLIKQYVYSAR